MSTEEEKSSPVLKLFDLLDADLRKSEESGSNIKKLMEDYIANNEDWKEYVHFCDHKYSRNLVKANDMLELIVLCWLPHQVSPIHNHAGQRCWAGILEGTIQETQFIYQNTHQTTGSGPLEVESVCSASQGQVCYITDDIALHVLQPINNQRGVTLHLYSKPIAECNIYCSSTGEITKRRMGYYTINKTIQPNQGPSNICSPATNG